MEGSPERILSSLCTAELFCSFSQSCCKTSSTSTQVTDTPQNEDKVKAPRTENGTTALKRNADQPQEPTPTLTMQDLTSLMMTLFKTQEDTVKMLSDIRTILRHVIEQNVTDHKTTSDQLQQLSQQTTNVEKNLKLVSADLQKAVSPTTAPETAAICISNKVIEEKNQELSEILLQEKRQKKTQEQSIRVKRTISLQWTQSMNQRKKSYSNFVKNYKKAQLYKGWIESSPDFLPLKYKPKRVPGEIPSYTTAKIAEAKQRYVNDVNLMLEYSKIHQARVRKIDKTMLDLIKDSCTNEDETTTLGQIWTDETSEQEMRAAQAWLKTERFLTKKKHEDGLKNQDALTDISWDETLSRRLKTRYRPVQNRPVQYYYSPSPW